MESLFTWIEKVSKSRIKENKTALACTTVLIYMGIVRYLRYKNLRTIQAKYPDPQQVLDDPDAAQEIYSKFFSREFPFLARQGTEFALFKTYSIPSISRILASTGELVKRCPRRVEDTELILGEMLQAYGRIENQRARNPDTPQSEMDAQWSRSQEATARLNEIHGRYPTIRNEDYLYTAALFVTEPQSWINRFEWRKLDVRESNAIFRIWYDVSVSMNLKNIPDSPQKLEDFKNAYAKENVKYSASNWKCAEPTLRLLLSNLPRFLQAIGYELGLRVLPSMLDPQDAKAFQLPHAEVRWITWCIHSLLSMRAFFIRHFLLPRSLYVVRTPFQANTGGRLVPTFFIYKPHIYQDGYRIADLGPEKKGEGGKYR
ncbi:uncharacterized protein EV154DRAFT_59624 [Mucor mucedo]|uniref:uncharacterized protein n=1 Tax=Mucor mucedo TaxID=29922 RepID=UPI0022203E57|nr:uncharacterized protein EV154DRAFT_59624 [Mucor mucedo]KAI7894880.1 hypothetical protein EV154DRAFT_59624 [Mucor mucedo]